jgi:hypothetical protein
VLPLDMSVLQQPLLPLDMSVLQQPLLPLDMSVLQQTLLPLNLSHLGQPVLLLDVSDLQPPVLHLDVSTACLWTCLFNKACVAFGRAFSIADCAARTFLSHNSLCYPWTILVYSIICLQAACASSGRTCSTGACAVPGGVWPTPVLLHLEVSVYNMSYCAAPRCVCLQGSVLHIDVSVYKGLCWTWMGLSTGAIAVHHINF